MATVETKVERRRRISRESAKRCYTRNYEKNRKKILEKNRRWRAANRGWFKAYNADYYRQHSDQIKANIRRWREEHPEVVKAIRRRRKALKRGAQVGEPYTLEEVAEKSNWQCGICGQLVDPAVPYQRGEAATIDHIVPLVKGGEESLANAQLAHKSCNSRKGAS